jgi:hypothetical protein
VWRELLGAAPGSDVLGPVQRRAPLGLREPQQVLGDQRDRAPRALLPGRVGGGLDDDLAHDAPARMMRFAAGDQEAGERLRQDRRVGLCAVGVEEAQGFADGTPVLDLACEFSCPAAGPSPGVGRGFVRICRNR